MTDIPEDLRRKALYSALYHHDGVMGRDGGERDGDPIRVEFYPEGHPDHVEGARQYVKRMANALGFDYASEGQFRVKLQPDVMAVTAKLELDR